MTKREDYRQIYDLSEVLSDINQWQLETFPHATKKGAMVHLAKEKMEAAEELADVVFLAGQAGDFKTEDAAIRCIRELSLDPAKVLAAKLEKNKARKWPTEPDADGVYEHLEETT
jgi:hypothetical protein